MNNLARYGVLIGALLPPLPMAAGLNLSDTPLFVAEVLAPNVVISPVYSVAFNEAVLKDVPWSTKAAFLTTDVAWNASQWIIGRTAFRVTPWPDTFVSTPADRSKCIADPNTAITYACSDTSLYANSDVYSDATYAVVNEPLAYHIKMDGTFGDRTGIKLFYSQEAYPQRPAGVVDNRFAEAKSRYFHSDSNFLYFSPTVADANAYQPWPSLGGGAFPAYAGNAQARYSPLNAAAGSVQLDAFLQNPMTNGAGNNVVNYEAYVGQYWVKTPGADVTDPANFAGTCWDLNTAAGIGCASEMTASNKTSFANWFTYWRSSGMATRGMLGNLFDRLAQADLLDKFRFGIFTSVNGQPSFNGFYSTQTTNLLETVRGIIYSPTTRFAKAWDFAKTDAKLGELDAYRDTAVGPVRSCRRNYEILLTPDYSGLAYASSAPANRDANNADNLANVPYPDNYADMWSDVGALGWATDLRGDLANNLLPGLRDPATHQHVVRYIIGPNAEGGSIFPKGKLSYEQATAKAQQATGKSPAEGGWPALPAGTQNEFTSTYDDLWHMALNSHGFYYPSENVKDAVTSLLDAFNDIITRNVSGSSVATNTTSLQSGGQIYQAGVESDWKGHLRSYSIVSESKTINGVAQNVLSVNYGVPNWDVAEKVSAAPSRNIFTYNRDTSSGAPFDWGSIGPAARSALLTGIADNNAVKAQKLLEFLRGSGECEDGAATTCSAAGVPYTFRRRNLDRSNLAAYSLNNPNGRNVLGDVSNSNPWYVPPPRAGMSDVDYPGYNAHRISKKGRLNTLYFGANDGMLHAIRTDGNDAGKELFAYIPSFVQDNLPALADPAYAHKFYVDGSPFSAEVNIENVGWRTVLAGGANKGGKGYYLLNITDPAVAAEDAATAQSLVLWEFTHADMLYTYNLPVAFSEGHARAGQARQIARLNNGKWVLIVGNGYPQQAKAGDPVEAPKQACLFIINLSGPGNDGWTENTDYKKLCVGSPNGYVTTAEGVADGGLDTNGLSTPTPYDLDGDGNVDVVYAGDLNGNIWRFDVADADPANWTAPASPLFVAKNDAGQRQPIFAPPEVTLHTVGNQFGRLVLFGTGKFVEASDRSNVNVQSFYGVWDRNDVNFVNMSRGVLYQQSFIQGTSGNATIRKQDSKVAVAYCTGATLAACNTVKTVATDKMGWYWDMGDNVQHDIGERLTGRVSLDSGIVFFNTFYPALDATGELDPCQYGGSGWIMGLNAASGYMEDQQPVFDVNQDGVIDSQDIKSAGVKVGAAIGGTTFSRGGAGSKVGVYSPTDLGTAASEGKRMTIVINPGANSSGRVSWYELVD